MFAALKGWGPVALVDGVRCRAGVEGGFNVLVLQGWMTAALFVLWGAAYQMSCLVAAWIEGGQVGDSRPFGSGLWGEYGVWGLVGGCVCK